MLPVHKSNKSVYMDAGQFCKVGCNTDVEFTFLKALRVIVGFNFHT